MGTWAMLPRAGMDTALGAAVPDTGHISAQPPPAPATGVGNPVFLGEETRSLEVPGGSGQLWRFLWIIYPAPHAANQNKSIQLLLPF